MLCSEREAQTTGVNTSVTFEHRVLKWKFGNAALVPVLALCFKLSIAFNEPCLLAAHFASLFLPLGARLLDHLFKILLDSLASDTATDRDVTSDVDIARHQLEKQAAQG